MTPQAYRGRWIFLVVAALAVTERLCVLVILLEGKMQSMRWGVPYLLLLLFTPVVLALLWQGEKWIRWCVSLAFIIHGAIRAVSVVLLSIGVYRLPPEFFVRFKWFSLPVEAMVGVFYFGAGLAFMLLPSLVAFFSHQRARTSA